MLMTDEESRQRSRPSKGAYGKNRLKRQNSLESKTGKRERLSRREQEKRRGHNLPSGLQYKVIKEGTGNSLRRSQP